MDCETLIIGAGPGGLAVGAALRRANKPFEIIERGDRLGSSWRHHYDRLHLHTPKRHSSLPSRPFPKSAPRYPSRDEVVAYLDDYARAFDIRPELGVEATRFEKIADGWRVHTNQGACEARHLVVATGSSRVPCRPSWPGLESFGGRLLHSAEYANGQTFRGQRVLVVGFGNSGAEIALDLAESGAECSISVRGAVNVVPRDVLGVPITYLALASRRLPPRVADRMNALTIRLTIGDLASAGLRKRKDGPIREIVESRQIPVVDVGTIAALREGRISARPAIASIDDRIVRFVDGSSASFDAIVLATGYETGLRSLFDGAASILDERGYPRTDAREMPRGLFFCGFHIVPAGLIREIGIEAVRIAGCIAAEARDTSAS